MRNVARNFKMLLLVCADRHKIRLVKQNVRRHQHGICEKPCVDIFGMLLRFVLKLRHAAELAHLREAAENP